MKEADPFSARTLLYYLGQASKLVGERQLARERLDITMRRLRSVSTKTVQAELDELERRISHALDVEKKLLQDHARDDLFHRKLRDKLAAVEQRLKDYVDVHRQREQRLREIEDKIVLKARHDSLRNQLAKLEARLSILKSAKRHSPARLGDLQKKIHKIKAALNL